MALTAGLAYDQNGHVFAGMGVDFADYDNDGWPDVFVNALANQKYTLFRNDKGHFDDVSDPIGLGAIACRTPAGVRSGLTTTMMAGWISSWRRATSWTTSN